MWALSAARRAPSGTDGKRPRFLLAPKNLRSMSPWGLGSCAIGAHVGPSAASLAPKRIPSQKLSGPRDPRVESTWGLGSYVSMAHVGLERCQAGAEWSRWQAPSIFFAPKKFRSMSPWGRGSYAIGAHVGPERCQPCPERIPLQKLSGPRDPRVESTWGPGSYVSMASVGLERCQAGAERDRWQASSIFARPEES